MSLNVENISYKDFKNICRTCLINCDVKFLQDNIISDVFFKLTNIRFETNGDLPQQICLQCFEKIYKIHEFTLQCKQTHYSLIKCSNDHKNSVLDDKQLVLNKTNELIKFEEEITIEEHKIELVVVDGLINENSNTNSDINIQVENPNDKILNTETQEFPYKCDVCKKAFRYFTSFKRHLSLSDCKRSFKCKICWKMFTEMKYLKEHMLVHSGERPHKCDKCTKSFFHKKNLNAHLRTHSGERHYKCDQCAKVFTHLNGFKTHTRTHSGEHPIKCDLCSKWFKHTNSLKTHMATHTGERPFKCGQCEKSYTLATSLNRHLRKHRGERPF